MMPLCSECLLTFIAIHTVRNLGPCAGKSSMAAQFVSPCEVVSIDNSFPF